MAWKFPISTNTAVTLGTTDDVYVAEGVVIGVAGTYAIEGTGLDHQVEIYGTVVTDSLAIYLHPASNSTVTSDVLSAKPEKLHQKEHMPSYPLGAERQSRTGQSRGGRLRGLCSLYGRV